MYLETKFLPNRRIFVFWWPSKMAAIANQWWTWIRNIIIYLETKFRPNWRNFIFWRPFWIQNGRYSKPTMNINSQHHNLIGNQISSQSENFCILVVILKKMATITNRQWISIRNIRIYLETKFRPNRRIFVFWWPFWIQNDRHSTPKMDINLQHHNLLGNQISSKSEDFCILVAIMDSKWPP